MARKLDPRGSAQGKAWEGLPGTHGAPALTAYLDSAGVPTLGWGHTAGVKLGQTCSIEQAEQWWEEDTADACAAVESLVKAPLSDNQFTALSLFVLNVGRGAFASSTLLKKLNATPPDYASVPEELAKWKYTTDPRTKQKVVSHGLINRRALETSLWLLPDEALPPYRPELPQVRPTLSQADMRTVEVSNLRPTPPPKSAMATKTGRGSLLAALTGSGGAVITGFSYADSVAKAAKNFFSNFDNLSAGFVVLGAALAVSSIGFSVYVYWQKHRSMTSDTVS